MTRKICPTCNGKGTIPNPKNSYNPTIECPNCQGDGFVGTADNLIKRPIYTSK